MRGTKQLIIDTSEFLKGMSSGAEVSDGGFSDNTAAVNLIAEPGILYPPAQAADADTDNRLSTTVSIIASAPDMATAMADNRLLIGNNSSQDGTFYRYDGTKIIAAAYATDTTRNFAKGITDIITYAGEAYVTSFSHIARWQNDNTITQDFFAFTVTTVPHPALVFENNAYYGDGNTLKRQTAAAGAPATILTLSSDKIIVALGIDPSSGLMLISTVSTWNASNTGTGTHRVIWYDGFSNKVTKQIIVEDMVTVFHSHGGIVFVGYGTKIGYLTGSGIAFLRQLRNVSLAQAQLPWKHNFASVGNNLYVVDGHQVLCFGEVLKGSKIFYYAYRNWIGGSASSTVFTFLGPMGNNRIGLSEAGQFVHFDVTSIATIDQLSFLTNVIDFGGPVYLRRVQLEFINNISSGVISLQATTEQRSGLTLGTEWGTLTNKKIHGYIGFGADDDADSQKATQLQLTLSFTTTSAGLRRIIVYYDPAE